jgi:hypothetical protein
MPSLPPLARVTQHSRIFLRLPCVTQTLGAHWGSNIWFFLHIQCLQPNGLLASLFTSTTCLRARSLRSPDRSTRARWFARFSRRLARQIDRWLARRARRIVRCVPKCVPSLRSADLSTPARWRTDVGFLRARTRTRAAAAMRSLPPLGFGLPRQNFETPHPALAKLASPPLVRLPCVL